MTPDTLAALRTGAGAAALAAATPLAERDQLSAVESLRRQGHPPELASAALGQARLRHRATVKFDTDAADMFFTTDGLQQATRPVVADRRARRIADSGVSDVLDLCCGIGSDAVAFARAGLRVVAVDADPGTAAVAAANAEALGVADRVRVRCADATNVGRSDIGAVFCDPARRSGNRRVFDPAAYSPPWSFLLDLATGPACLKLGPGIDHTLLPAGVEAEWVSVRGDVVEAALWCGPLAGVPRRATVLADGRVDELTGSGDREAQVGPVRRYLYDPDGTVLRAHLLAELADRMGATIADPSIGYLYTDTPADTPFARGYEITDVLPFSLKGLRALLRERGVGRLTIKKRGSALVPETLRRQLRLSGPAEATVVLTRVDGAPTVIICRPLPSLGR